MKIIPAFFCLSILLQAQACWAYKVPAEWAHCERDAQCVIVDAGCGVKRAANKNFAEKAHGDIMDKVKPFACTKPIEGHPANTAAKCESNRCLLSPPGGYAGSNNPIEQ